MDSLALVLSVFAIAVLAAFVSDCLRRDPDTLPLAGRLPKGLSGHMLRVVWIAGLAASFVGGLYGFTVRERNEAREGQATDPPATETRRTLRLPFYVRVETVTASADGSFLGSTRSTRTQIPWAFLAVAGLYGLGAAGAGGAADGGGQAGGDRTGLTPPSA